MTEFRLFRFRSPLLTESLLIYFPPPTEMFQFGWYPTYHYLNLSIIFMVRSPPHRQGDYSIRKPPDQWSMAPPRRISLPYASFLGTNTQGIHCQLYSVVENKGPVRQLADRYLFSYTFQRNLLQGVSNVVLLRPPVGGLRGTPFQVAAPPESRFWREKGGLPLTMQLLSVKFRNFTLFTESFSCQRAISRSCRENKYQFFRICSRSASWCLHRKFR